MGAGPGHPGLITVLGRELLRSADVVACDRLITAELLEDVRPEAEVVYAGKAAGDHTLSQDQIQRLLVDRARAGKLVVRLKGGDPFVFGRGYEELTACRDAGVECFVIPGVSSATAGPMAAGIPLTDRRFVRSFAVVTARTAHDSTAPPLDYKALACIDTVVILMGRANLADVARSLVDGGRSPETPAACIEWATTSKQRVTVSTLATIAADADQAGMSAPIVTVVGAVAAMGSEENVETPAVSEAPKRQNVESLESRNAGGGRHTET